MNAIEQVIERWRTKSKRNYDAERIEWGDCYANCAETRAGETRPSQIQIERRLEHMQNIENDKAAAATQVDPGVLEERLKARIALLRLDDFKKEMARLETYLTDTIYKSDDRTGLILDPEEGERYSPFQSAARRGDDLQDQLEKICNVILV